MPVTCHQHPGHHQLQGAGWASSTPASAVPSSTPADLLSASPGRPNLFLPVVPGPQRTPQTPTGEGREQLPRPPAPPTLLPAALPRGSPQPPTTTGTQEALGTLPAVPGGTWQLVPLSPPQCKGRRGRKERRCPPPRTPAGGPLQPVRDTRGSSHGVSNNLTPGCVSTARHVPLTPGHTGTPRVP